MERDEAIFAPIFFEVENHESVHRKAVLRAIYRVQGVDAPLLGVFDVKNPCCKTHKQNLRVPRTNIGILDHWPGFVVKLISVFLQILK